MVDDGDAVAEALGFFNIVGGQQDGFLFATQFFDDVVNFAANLRVEAGRGFVEKHDFRIVDQRHGQGEALLLAAGKFFVEGVAFFFELKPFQQAVGAGAVPVETGKKIKRFLHL